MLALPFGHGIHSEHARTNRREVIAVVAAHQLDAFHAQAARPEFEVVGRLHGCKRRLEVERTFHGDVAACGGNQLFPALPGWYRFPPEATTSYHPPLLHSQTTARIKQRRKRS